MIKKTLFAALCFLVACTLSASSKVDQEILKKIVEQLKKNETIAESYDFYQDTHVNDRNKDGKVEKVEKFTYRTIPLEGQRYYELIKFDGKELDAEKKKEEAKRREKFVKKIKKKEKDPEDDEDDLTWEEVAEKYEFTHLPPEGDAAYVISFKPRSAKLKEKNRLEKVVNRLVGKFWVSSDYNIIKAEADLTSAVNYGLGVIAHVEELHAEYTQSKVDGNWLPEAIKLNYKARIFVKTRIREIQSRYYNLTKRPDNASASSAQSQ